MGTRVFQEEGDATAGPIVSEGKELPSTVW